MTHPLDQLVSQGVLSGTLIGLGAAIILYGPNFVMRISGVGLTCLGFYIFWTLPI